jgi:uncharacterized protein
MKAQILFMQGAGEGAHEEDKKLVSYLQMQVGTEYNVHYPEMPGENEADYQLLRNKIDEELEKLDGKVILVGHSVGGNVLMKYITEGKIEKNIVGIFFIAVPYWGGDGGWQYEGYEEFTLQEGYASKFPSKAPIFFYQSNDDEIVPFTHLGLYAKKFPQATIRKIVGRGHQLNNDLSEVVQDIRSLSAPV